MAMQDTIKRVAYFAGLNGLASCAGLSAEASETFYARKEYKTNFNFLLQCTVAINLRANDILAEQGVLDSAGAGDFHTLTQRFAAVSPANPIVTLPCLKGQNNNDPRPEHNDSLDECPPEEKRLNLEARLDTHDVLKRGKAIRDGIAKMSAEDLTKGFPNFSLFAEIVLCDLLLAYVLMHLAGRAGNLRMQIEQQKHLVPYVMTTTRTSINSSSSVGLKYLRLAHRWSWRRY